MTDTFETSASGTLLLLGGGGHAAVVTETARAIGWSVVGYLDDDPTCAARSGSVGLERRGGLADLANVVTALGTTAVHAAIGDNATRARWLELIARLEAREVDMPAIVHPSAVVSPSATIGAGAFVGPHAIINARAAVAAGAIVNSGAIVEHDCVVGPCAHVAPRAVLAGAARIDAHCLVGAGAVLVPGASVGHGSTIGAGAVVTSDIPGGVTAVGVPARTHTLTRRAV